MNDKDNNFMSNSTVKPGGGVSGKRDPLTVGKVTYGEDIKGNSTHDEVPTNEDVANDKANQTVADQEERDAVASTPDALLPEDPEKTEGDEPAEPKTGEGTDPDPKVDAEGEDSSADSDGEDNQ